MTGDAERVRVDGVEPPLEFVGEEDVRELALAVGVPLGVGLFAL
jgi:hypothetical protein